MARIYKLTLRASCLWANVNAGFIATVFDEVPEFVKVNGYNLSSSRFDIEEV